jgi:ferritin-like metal-binding protein YciE
VGDAARDERRRSFLKQTLQQEMNAEKLLTQIAKSHTDKTAATKAAA